MRSSKGRRSALLVLFALLPGLAWAHVKWFVPVDEGPGAGFVPYSLHDRAVIVWIIISVLLVSFSVFLDSRLPSIRIVDSKMRRDIVSILRFCTGMSLLLTAYEGSVIAPHYTMSGSLGVALLVLAGLIGILLMSNHFLFQTSVLMLVLYAGLIVKLGFVETIEYWNFIGIALFLMFNNFKSEKYIARFKPYSVPALRIFTGIALITLGLTEKLLGAEYGEAFIAQYHWNFMPNLGFENYSDRLFVLSAGFMEVVFGTILILGTTTRLNVLVVSGFMLTSNITFLVQGHNEAALMELVGHLPIIATAVICIFFGYGQRMKVTSLFRKDQAPAVEIRPAT
jgi:uncharacterized membrane protein YphA (DoxX/SURF4 family)